MPAQSTYTPIQTVTATNTNSSDYVFTNIPSTYTDLMVVVYTRGVASYNPQQFAMYLGDSTSLWQSTQYGYNTIYGDGSSVGATRTNNASGYFQYGGIPGGTSSTNAFSTHIFHIMNYANTSVFKTIISRSAKDLNGSGTTAMQVCVARSTTAVTRVGVATYGDGNLAVGTTFTLYGIGAA